MYTHRKHNEKIVEILELNIFGEETVFDHIGLAVKSIKDIADSEVRIIDDKRQKVFVAFISMHGIKIELIEPNAKNSPVSDSMAKGQYLVHLCFRVPDIDLAVKKARENGFHRISLPVPAPAFDDKKIVWVFSKTYGLMELLEIL